MQNMVLIAVLFGGLGWGSDVPKNIVDDKISILWKVLLSDMIGPQLKSKGVIINLYGFKQDKIVELWCIDQDRKRISTWYHLPASEPRKKIEKDIPTLRKQNESVEFEGNVYVYIDGIMIDNIKLD